MKKQITQIVWIILAQLSFLTSNAVAEELKPQPIQKIKIDIVSDVVCPWCAIGYQRLAQAIDDMNMQDNIEIEWHPFELNPTMPSEGVNANQYLMNKYDLNPEQLIAKRNKVTKLGKELGFTFDYFKEMKKLNSFNVHVLLDYAQEFNKQTELAVRFTKAYFSERKDISKPSVLALEVKHIGLDADEALKRLNSHQAQENVRKEEAHWMNLGISSIPTMVFNNETLLEGAASVATYKKVLTKMLKKQTSKP